MIAIAKVSLLYEKKGYVFNPLRGRERGPVARMDTLM